MMKPVQTLPATYIKINRIDLKQNIKLAILLNLAAIPIFLGFGLLLLRYIAAVRPDARLLWGALGGLPDLLLLLVGLFVIVVIHEMVLGIFFWYFTHSRPNFAFKVLYAYASAPDWYIPRNQYVIIGLAPITLITLVGMLLILVLPIYAVAVTFILVSFNAAGAVGDLAVTGWLLTRNSNLLICDEGDAATVYGPTERETTPI